MRRHRLAWSDIAILVLLAATAAPAAAAAQSDPGSSGDRDEPNPIQKALSDENRDMTFGLLWTLLLLGGITAWFGPRWLRRRRFRRELKGIQAIAADANTPAPTRRRRLDERQQRLEALHARGRISTDAVRVLERRIDEVHRALHSA